MLAALGILAVPPERAAYAQTTSFKLVWSGDISPPTNETKGDDYATSEIVLKEHPDLVCTAGDDQYETGTYSMFASPVGFDGSWGRVKGLTKCPAVGNHDVADPGAGAPGFRQYFSGVLNGLLCQSDPVPCHPERGYYVVDLDVDRNGQQDWFITILDSDCGRAGGGTGDVETPSCTDNGEQANWLRAVYNARHGGQTSGRKCSLAIWHHERWGTGFFADDPATQYLWNVVNHYHGDVVLSGHTHSVARLGPMTPTGSLSSTGAGIRQITAGAGGRSLTANRVNPARTGTRYRNNTLYGVNRLVLTSSASSAGWLTGSWTSSFIFTNGTVADAASAGCWV